MPFPSGTHANLSETSRCQERHSKGSMVLHLSTEEQCFVCMVESMGGWRDLCWEQEQGLVLGRGAAVTGSSREAPLSILALQVDLGSLQARQVLTSSETFLEITASSASICSPVTV